MAAQLFNEWQEDKTAAVTRFRCNDQFELLLRFVEITQSQVAHAGLVMRPGNPGTAGQKVLDILPGGFFFPFVDQGNGFYIEASGIIPPYTPNKVSARWIASS